MAVVSCADDEKACYSTEPLGPGTHEVGVPCGMSEGQLTKEYKVQLWSMVCYPDDECPSPCEVDRITSDLVAEFDATYGYEIRGTAPLCREERETACCYSLAVDAEIPDSVVP